MNWIRNYWPFVLFMLTISALAGETRLQVAHNEESIVSIKRDDLREIKDQLKNISVAVQLQAVAAARQEQYLSGIHEQLQEIKRELRGHADP